MFTKKPLNPKLDAIREKYRNGITAETVEQLADKLTGLYFGKN